MTNVLSRALPEPSNWQDFERLCFDVFSRVWKTNDAEMHGRVGQPQAGVDVYGTDRVEGRFVGVQCKGKDQSYGNPLTANELREEIKKAKTFDPPLDVFILATTAPNDATIQKLARELTQKHKTAWPVRGPRYWLDHLAPVGHGLSRYRQEIFSRLCAGRRRRGHRIRTVRTTRAFLQEHFTSLAAMVERGDPNDRLRTRILDLVKLIDDGSVDAGRKALGAPLVEGIRQRNAPQSLSDPRQYWIRLYYARRPSGRHSGIARRRR